MDYLRFVQSIVRKGGRVRQHTVFDYLPVDIIKRVDELVKREGHSRAGALFLHLTQTPSPVCPNCQKQLRVHMWPRKGTKRIAHCTSICAGADPNTDKKRQRTSLKKYGVRHVQEHPKYREKFKQSMLEKHGVEYTAQSPILREKMKDSVFNHFGVIHQNHAPEVIAKARVTWNRNYGSNPAKLRDLAERMKLGGHKTKEFAVQGKTFRMQGYEPEAIYYLVSLGIPVSNIVTTAKERMPFILWEDAANYEHNYFPDIYAKYKGRWTLFEVKSTYTAGLHRSQSPTIWARNKAKFKAAVEEGYTLILIMVHKRKTMKNRCRLIHAPHLHTRKSLREELQHPHLV